MCCQRRLVAHRNCGSDEGDNVLESSATVAAGQQRRRLSIAGGFIKDSKANKDNYRRLTETLQMTKFTRCAEKSNRYFQICIWSLQSRMGDGKCHARTKKSSKSTVDLAAVDSAAADSFDFENRAIFSSESDGGFFGQSRSFRLLREGVLYLT